MDDVYEVCDVTDDEAYYTVGVYSTLDRALAVLDQAEPIETHNDADYLGVIEFEVRKRPVDKYTERGKVVATVTWTQLPIKDFDEDVQYERGVVVSE